MKKLLPLLILLSSFAYSQSMPVSFTGTISLPKTALVSKATVDSLKSELKKLRALADSLRMAVVDQDPKGIFRRVVLIENRPSGWSTQHTTVQADDYATGFFTFAQFGGTASVGKDVTLSGAFPDGMSINGFTATANPSPRYRISNANTTVVIGAPSANHSIQTIGSASGFEFYGKSASEPLLLTNTTGNGAQFISTSFGGRFKIVNAVIRPKDSGVTCNAGGTVYTYSHTEKFVRVFAAGQECFYDGNSSVYTDYIDYDTVVHCAGYNSSREGLQRKHVNHLYARNNTWILPGQTGGAGQDHAYEIQDVIGEVGYELSKGAPTGPSFFTHHFRFHHNVATWTTNAGIIGRTDNQYFAASARLDGVAITIENNCFKKEGALAAFAFNIQERTANIVFANNTFENFTAIYQDNRVAGYSNTIIGTIGTNGNVSGTCPTITVPNVNPDDYERHMLIDATTRAALIAGGYGGAGYRNK